LLEEYKKEENEKKKEPTRSLVKFTTVGLGNELAIFSSGCTLLPSFLFVACKFQIGIRRIFSLSLVDSGVYIHVGASCRCGYSRVE
jgi:hypothetical protein